MVGFMAIRVASIVARVGRNLAGLLSYVHEFLALRVLSGDIPVIIHDS